MSACCPTCKGDGSILVRRINRSDEIRQCPTCHGTGRVPSSPTTKKDER